MVRLADRAPAPLIKLRRDTDRINLCAMLVSPVHAPIVGGNTTLIGDGIKTWHWQAVNQRHGQEEGIGDELEDKGGKPGEGQP